MGLAESGLSIGSWGGGLLQAWLVDWWLCSAPDARVPFLASPRKGTKRRGTLTPGPSGFPALLSRAGRLRNSPPAGAQTVLAEGPPPALRCSAGVERGRKPSGGLMTCGKKGYWSSLHGNRSSKRYPGSSALELSLEAEIRKSSSINRLRMHNIWMEMNSDVDLAGPVNDC